MRPTIHHYHNIISMRFAITVGAVGLVGVAAAQNATASNVYVTDVVTAFTTYW